MLFRSNLGCRSFPFITLSMSCHSLLAFRVSAEKSAVNLMGVPLYVICHFSLVAFKILSLSLIFFFNDTATTEIYTGEDTLSLHDALPIWSFSLAAFNNFSLSLIFANLITMCLGMFLLGFILYGTCCTSWT